MIHPDIDRNLFFIWRGLLAWFLITCAVMILSGCTSARVYIPDTNTTVRYYLPGYWNFNTTPQGNP
jgi:hypothetical protein